MKLWIARDKDNSLSVCTHKPIYVKLFSSWSPPKEYYNNDTAFHVYIDENLFPEVTFENSPMIVELKLIQDDK